MRLIDADVLSEGLYDGEVKNGGDLLMAMFQLVIDATPTVDAVPVCRCKDCSVGTCYSDGSVQCEWSNGFYADDYCPRGKRKGGDEWWRD